MLKAVAGDSLPGFQLGEEDAVWEWRNLGEFLLLPTDEYINVVLFLKLFTSFQPVHFRFEFRTYTIQ